MKIIEPFRMTSSVIESTNVPDGDYPDFTFTSAYSIGDRAVRNLDIYESVANDNLGNSPENDLSNSYWVRVGAINRWKAFDGVLQDQTTNLGEITYTLAPVQTVRAVAFFNLSADTVRVRVFDAAGAVVYDMIDVANDNSAVTDWHSYYYSEVRAEDQITMTDLPAAFGGKVEITITAAVAKVGEIVLGAVKEIGCALLGTQIGIRDYSTKERDAYGNVNIVERAFSRTLDVKFSVDKADVIEVIKTLEGLRAVPVVWLASRTYGAVVYGYYKDFRVNIQTEETSFCTLQVEGLV